MLNKTIRVFQEVHGLLSDLAAKDESFNYVIKKLIENNKEFTNKQSKSHNEKIENGIYANVSEVNLSELEERITRLEKEIVQD